MLKNLLKNSVIYTVFSLLPKIIGFFLLPLYTALLTPDDYGIVGIVNSIVSFLSIFYLLSLNSTFARYYPEVKDDKKKIDELFGTIFYTVILNSFLLSVILMILYKWIFPPILGDIPFYPYMAIGMISIALSPIYQVFVSTYQIRQMGMPFAVTNFCFFFVNIILNVIFITVFRLGAIGLIVSTAITNFGFSIYALFKFINEFGIHYKPNHLKKYLKYSLPLVPHNLSSWTMVMIDRLFINRLISTAVVGLYNVGFQVSNIMSMLVAAITQAYSPFFFEQMQNGDKGRNVIINVASLTTILLSFLGLILSVFSKEVIDIMAAEEYIESYKIVPFLTFSFVFNGVYVFVAGPLYMSSTHIFSIISVFGAILNVSLNIFMIPRYGFVGAAFASLLQRVITSIIYAFSGYYKEPVNFNWALIFGFPIGAFIVSFFLLNTLVGYSPIVSILIKLTVILCLLGILGIVFSKNVKMIYGLFRKKVVKKGS